MSEQPLAILDSRPKVLMLNTIILLAYGGIVLVADSLSVTLAGFLLLAVLIRCSTLLWMAWAAEHLRDSLPVVAFNLIGGLVFSAGAVALLWWLSSFWISGVRLIVSVMAVYVAYKSTFPVLPRRPSG